MSLPAERVRQLCCAACLGLSSLPMLRDDFLFSDDYYWYDIQHSRPWDVTWETMMLAVMNGRPLNGLMLLAAAPALAMRPGWVLLRGLGVIALIVTAWTLARTLRRVWDARTSDWAATAVVALPGFTLFSFWLVALPGLLAALCAVLAARFALEPTIGRRLLGATLLIAALANYQPFALVYFAVLAVIATAGQLAWTALGIGVASIGVYYALARLCIAVFGYEMAPRGELVLLPLEKARWFLESALPFSAQLWSIQLPAWIGLALLSLAALLHVGQLRSDWRAWAKRAGFIALCMGLCVLPHLSVRETVTRWRTLLPLSVLLALLLLAGLRVTRWPRALLAGAVVALLTLRAVELDRLSIPSERGIVLAAEAELKQVLRAPAAPPARPGEQSSLSAATQAPSRVFVLRAADGARSCVARLSDDEFTAPSSQREYAIDGIVRLASELAGVGMPVITQGERASEADAPILDLRHVPAAICAQVLTQ